MRRFYTNRVRLLWLAAIFVLPFELRAADSTEISFRYDVMPVLSKSGCNLGTCHGNARGKGGFQISLRGQDPDADYDVLTRALFGRRVNSIEADQSLLLLKPTMQVPHEGGKRFTVDSVDYKLLRDWIAAGMPKDSAETRQLVSLNVSPTEAYLNSSAESARSKSPKDWQLQIRVIARFSDHTERDVTSLAVYELANPIVDMTHDGLATGKSAGETTILVRYSNLQVPVRVAFVADRPGFAWNGPSPANFVDEKVFAKLQKLKINPSPVCDDATFVRRVTFDLTGLPPTTEEAQRFVNDTSTDKRQLLIDTLLERPEFAEWWALKWADLLRVEEKTLDQKGVENVTAWLRDAFAHNKPLDQVVRELVAGRGSTYEVPPANFYRALRNPFERSEAVGQLFLGIRLQCAKCHNHPFDRWTQNDYYSWGSVFSRVDYKIMENRRRDSNDKHEFDGEQIVFINDTGTAKDPRTDRPRAARFLGGRDDLDPNRDPLDELAAWLTDAGNERFVQVLANRTWKHVMGRGIVEPEDDFRATNPASNPELLKALADKLKRDQVATKVSEFAGTFQYAPSEQAFDLRRLLRVILNSNTYQLASDANATNVDDESNFSHAIVHRRTAEQLLDAISLSLQIPLEFSRYPVGQRAAQLPGVVANLARDARSTDADRFLRLFGKPPRLQSCDCERSDETTLSQTFQLVSGPMINRMLAEKGNRLERLLNSNSTPAEIVQELYWATLTRPPTTEELDGTVRYLQNGSNRRVALEDLAWALFNSNEFLLRK